MDNTENKKDEFDHMSHSGDIEMETGSRLKPNMIVKKGKADDGSDCRRSLNALFLLIVAPSFLASDPVSVSLPYITNPIKGRWGRKTGMQVCFRLHCVYTTDRAASF